MSSSLNTPQSVLDAPTLLPVMVSIQGGKNRHDRRHVTYKARGKSYLIPKQHREAATNVPFAGPTT
jgi:hypothetical protein